MHMIIARHGRQPLEAVIRDIKKYTSVKLIDAIQNNPTESRKELLLWLFKRAGHHNSNNTQYQFWQQHNHPIELNTNEVFDQRLDYIHNNPVQAGLCNYPEEYKYSSASFYLKNEMNWDFLVHIDG